jgi:cell division protein ZapA
MKTENTIVVTVMGKEFQLNCPEEEREALLLAVSYLNEKSAIIKEEGKVTGLERIAIVTALSMTHELFILQNDSGFDINEFKRRMSLEQQESTESSVEQDSKTQ